LVERVEKNKGEYMKNENEAIPLELNKQMEDCYERWTQEEDTERNPKATEVEPEQVKSLLSDVSVANLKCCGNCRYRESIDMGNDFSEKCEFGNHMESSAYCESWDFDNLTIKERHD